MAAWSWSGFYSSCCLAPCPVLGRRTLGSPLQGWVENWGAGRGLGRCSFRRLNPKVRPSCFRCQFSSAALCSFPRMEDAHRDEKTG